MKDKKKEEKMNAWGRKAALYLSIFLSGMIFGIRIIGQSSRPASSKSTGSVLHFADLPWKNTAHAGIQKKQFIEPFVIPNFSGFQVASLKAGQLVESHEHPTMHEIFYVISGKAIFTVDSVDHEASPGTMIHLAPHQWHSISALESADGDLVTAYLGVTI